MPCNLNQGAAVGTAASLTGGVSAVRLLLDVA